MQTLARYFVALLLFLFTYFVNDEIPEEQLTGNTVKEQSETPKIPVCDTTAVVVKSIC